MPISAFGAQRAGSVIRLLLAIAVVFGVVASCQKLDVTAVEVMEVEVSPTSATVLVGQTRQFTVTLTDAAGNTLQRSVNWSSGNNNIATVDGDGQVRGVGPGTTTVTASSGGRSGQATVNVAATLVTSVEVIPNTAGLRPGEFVDLQAVAKDGNGAVVPGKIPSWVSQNPSIASVTQAGRVTAGVVGATRVTATIDGRVGEAAITVSSDPVASVQVLPPTGSVAEGEFLQLQVVLRNTAGTVLTGRLVTFTTSNANVATVTSPDGRVTGVTVGTATITASSEGRTGQSVITVTPRSVATIEVTPPSAGLVVGGTVTLEAVAKATDGTVLLGRTFAWSSSAPSVASVTNGLVRGLAIGESTITATADGKSGSARVFVTNQPVATVEIQPSTGNVIEGDSINLTGITRDLAGNVLSNRVITWSSSNNAIATVVPTTGGAVKLKAVAAGNVTITATSEGRSGTANFVVQQIPVTAVEVLPLTATVFSGGSQGYQATVRSGSIVLTNRPVQWSSSDPNTATITPTSPGALTATANAAATPPCPAPAQSCNATLSATAGGITGNATLTVLKRIATIQLAPATLTLTVGGAGAQVTADVRASDNTQLTSRVLAWTSSSPNVGIAVAPGGQAATLTAVGATCVGQSCTIQVIASAEGVADTVIVTVPKPVASVTITPPSMTLFVGDSTNAQAVVRASDQTVLDRVVTWNTTNSSIATATGSGTFGLDAKVKAGTCLPNIGTCQANITATAEGVVGNATVVVRKHVATVVVQPNAITVDMGKTTAVRAVLTAADGSPITDRTVGWTTNAPTIATVTGTGAFQLDATINGVNLGPATITAAAEGVSGSTSVTVVEPVASVEIQPANPALAEGDSLIVQAIVKGTSGNVLTNRVVTWQSTNSNLASVTGITAPYFPDAKLKALKCPVGQATCTVTIQAIASGIPGQTILTVNKVLHHVTITPNPAPPLLAGSGGSSGTLQLTARPEADDGTLLNVPVTSWATSNSFIATVDNTGFVTAVAADFLCPTQACPVTISATAGGMTGGVTIDVRKPVVTIEVTPAAANMSVSGNPYPTTQVFTAVLRSLDGTALTYVIPTWNVTGIGSPPGQVTLSTQSGSSTTATATRQGIVNLTASAQGKSSLIVVITITP